jgi:hypothetical protein
MGMAEVITKETPKPRYSGTEVCKNCHAEFKPGEWCKGIYHGLITSQQFLTMWRVEDGCCPMCGEEGNDELQ